MNRATLAPAFCAANKIIVTGEAADSITFGLVNSADSVLKQRISKTYPGRRCIFREMNADDFNLRISQLYSGDECEDGLNEKSVTEKSDAIDKVADDAPVINLLNSLFLEAISKRASDIHIESGSGDAAIHYRVDGLLVPARTISAERAASISTRLKILGNLNVLENRRPQDGHIEINADACSLDARISAVPTIWGESIVLRLLNRSDVPLRLDSLGFSEKHYTQIKNILSVSSGLVLVTGPTGSGKTTTLAAILGEINGGNLKIISIEDPVEYRIEGITQIQVHEELKLTFENLLRRIFRQDPDVIMIGEIRDIETAELAVRAAMTGHLVFATLHTNSAAEAVYRLQNMGIPGYMTGAVLKTVISQRLLRKVCTVCNGSGCENCLRTGYSGRTAIAEVITIDEKIRNMISSGSAIEHIKNYLDENAHSDLFDDADLKLKAGITTAAEIRRELGIRT